jgi:hypothetical protein
MPPTATPSASDPQRPDTSTFLEQQAAILLDAPDNDTMVRRLLAAALQRISALEQQLAAAPPGRPRPQPSLRPRILTLLRGGVSNVDMDGKNTLQIKAIRVVISTFETLPNSVITGPISRTEKDAFMRYLIKWRCRVITPWQKGAHSSRAIASKALAGTHRTNHIDIQQVVMQSRAASMTTLDRFSPSLTGRIRISTVICYASCGQCAASATAATAQTVLESAAAQWTSHHAGAGR